jgi:hypothetical protein
MKNPVIQKLTDKGFDGADIHLFLQRFNIGVWIAEPYMPPFIFASSDADLFAQRQKIEKDKEVHYNKQLKVQTDKWDLADIAADFEKHK